jgi:hypothetical protein
LDVGLTLSELLVRVGSEKGEENAKLVATDEGVIGLRAEEGRDISSTEGLARYSCG